MSFVRFLRLAEEIGESPLHAHTFNERLGAASVGELRAAGLLVAAGFRADYHCGGAHGEGCPRRIVDDPTTSGAVLALCGRARPACASIRLGRSDTEALSISRRAIESALIGLFRVTPKTSAEPAPFVTLGEHRKPLGKMRDIAVVRGRGGLPFLTPPAPLSFPSGEGKGGCAFWSSDRISDAFAPKATEGGGAGHHLVARVIGAGPTIRCGRAGRFGAGMCAPNAERPHDRKARLTAIRCSCARGAWMFS